MGNKDNKRKFEPFDNFVNNLQSARVSQGQARMGNLEVQTVKEALGLDAHFPGEPTDGADNKEAKEHTEEEEHTEETTKLPRTPMARPS